jgi:hypothetical protein
MVAYRRCNVFRATDGYMCVCSVYCARVLVRCSLASVRECIRGFPLCVGKSLADDLLLWPATALLPGRFCCAHESAFNTRRTLLPRERVFATIKSAFLLCMAAVKENYIDVKQLAIETGKRLRCADYGSQKHARAQHSKNWQWKSDRTAAKIFPHCRRIRSPGNLAATSKADHYCRAL